MPDDITESIDSLTLRVRAYRIARYIEKGHQMSRLSEKLRQAGGVVGRQTARIEAKADELIAREPEIERQTDEKFDLHHSILDGYLGDVDHLVDDLRQISNDPLGESAKLLPTVTTGQIDQGRPHSEVMSDNLDNGKLSLNNPRRPV